VRPRARSTRERGSGYEAGCPLHDGGWATLRAQWLRNANHGLDSRPLSPVLLPILVILGAALASNFVLLAAILAGRLNQGWLQRVLLAVEMAFLVAAILPAVGVGLFVATAFGWQVARRDLRVALVGALFLAVAAVLGWILTYLEYSATGRRRAFWGDLRRSLWVGRSGVRRWDGGSR
jgi:hypothetical protein